VVGDPMLKKFEPARVTSGNDLFKHCRTQLVKRSHSTKLHFRGSRKSSEESAARARRPTCALPHSHSRFRSAPRSNRRRHSLTLYASLLKNDLGSGDGCAVCLAYFLEIGVEEAFDARFDTVFLLGEQVPSGCHARCS
jgi:hypothetical protein